MNTCLSDDQVVEFVQGRFEPLLQAEIQEHIAACGFCRSLVAHAADLLLDAKPEPAGASADFGPDPVGAPLATGARVGRYVVLDVVGAGAMGTVYAVYDPQLNRRVALKLLRQGVRFRAPIAELQHRLLREAQAMARLSHPNVIPVHDVGTHGDGLFIAMDFVEGMTVRQWLDAAPRSWEEVLRVFSSAGRGLAAAHRAGLVHRDFKPENVLVGDDGRICVTDFGLARFAAEPGADPATSSVPSTALEASPLVVSLTKSGATLGTPAYMAPEQAQGGTTSPLADQFSFCVALYEGLYGERPFAGGSMSALREAALAGALREAPKGSRTPLWLRRVVLRGVRGKPEERFPTMDALLEALGQDPRRARRRLLIGLGVAALLAGALAYARYAGDPRQLCTGEKEELGRAWGDSQKRAVHGSFLATGVPYAEDTWRSTERALDAYGADWAAAHRSACRATRIRGVQSEVLLDLRMECLRARLRELGALVATFAQADAKLVEKTTAAVAGLRGLDLCANTTLLSARLPPPADAAKRARVEEVREGIARAQALFLSGRVQPGLLVAKEAASAAGALGYPPVEAEARYQLGDIQRTLDDPGAEESFHGAATAAEASRHDEISIKAFARLAWLLGFHHRTKEALRWADLAEAARRRVGVAPDLQALVLAARGRIYAGFDPQKASEYDRQALQLAERTWGRDSPLAIAAAGALAVDLVGLGRYREALPLMERNLAAHLQAMGPRSPVVGNTLGNLGAIYRLLGRYDDALDANRRAVAILEPLGATHELDVAIRLFNVGNVLADLDRSEEALAAHEKSLRIRERRLKGDHPRIANSLDAVGSALVQLGRYEEARSYLERGLAMRERRSGRGAPATAASLGNLGKLFLMLRDGPRAASFLQRAIAAYEKTGETEMASSLETLGTLRFQEGRLRDALGHYERGLSVREKAQGEDHLLVGALARRVGETWLALGEPARARPYLERAVRILEREGRLPNDLAEADLALARVIRAKGGTPTAARQRALAALAALRRARRPHPDLRTRVRAFLTETKAE
jgi:tetratricopeptide (TPR) repeat protein/tRNA A-37 threonylcarbamoyl transferase component Bud32